MASFTPNHAPLLRTKFSMEHWQNFTSPNLLNLLKEKGFDDVKYLWFDNPVFAFLLDSIRYEKSILRVADNLEGFCQSWPALIEKEYEIAKRADRVVYTARILSRSLPGVIDEGKMRHVPNGVDFEFFEKADDELFLMNLRIFLSRELFMLGRLIRGLILSLFIMRL